MSNETSGSHPTQAVRREDLLSGSGGLAEFAIAGASASATNEVPQGVIDYLAKPWVIGSSEPYIPVHQRPEYAAIQDARYAEQAPGNGVMEQFCRP